MTSDPLSDILQLANAQPRIIGGFTAGGAWALRFPPPDKIKFFAVLKGSCWLILNDGRKPVYIREGDLFVISLPESFTIGANLSTPAQDAVQLFKGKERKFIKIGKRTECVQIGGHVTLDPINGDLLLSLMPSLIHIRRDSPNVSTLRWLLTQLVEEQKTEQPGSEWAKAQLVQLLFGYILRICSVSNEQTSPTLWRALADAKTSAAIGLMHKYPDHTWTLAELARKVGMSRTAFAVHFKHISGTSALLYLQNWRMRLAKKALHFGNVRVNELAQSLGYTSESAFSHAFKRITGLAPKRFASRLPIERGS